MSATAFVMATFLEIPYSEIVVAAAFPSLLYYFGLFLQIDAYSARYGLQGLPAEELPSIGEVLRDGWYFIAVFVLLIVMLLYLQREAQAPYYATVLLIAINQMSRKHRWTAKRLGEFVEGIGKLFAELAAILAGVGLIIGALTLTGKVGSLTYELVRIAGNDAEFAIEEPNTVRVPWSDVVDDPPEAPSIEEGDVVGHRIDDFEMLRGEIWCATRTLLHGSGC